MEEKKKSHLGLKLLGIWYVIVGVLTLLGGIALLVLGSLVGIILSVILIGIPILIASIVIGGILIVIGLLYLIVGVSLFREKLWAFYLLFILTTISLIMDIITFNWISAIFQGLIFFYLLLIHKDMNPKFCKESGFGKVLCISKFSDK